MASDIDTQQLLPAGPLVPGATAPINALVVGASRGIGAAFARLLAVRSDIANLFLAVRTPRATDTAGIDAATPGSRVRWLSCDLTEPASLVAMREQLAATASRLHLVVNTAGMLHAPGIAPEKSIRQLDPEVLARAFAVNAAGVALLARELWPMLAHREPLVFASLSARVGSIGDNRLGGWYAYRASKAAHNQLLHTLAIELSRINPRSIVLALHPGTVDTELSRPFQSGVAPGQLLSAEESASRLLAVMAARTPAESGGFFAWDGRPVEW